MRPSDVPTRASQHVVVVAGGAPVDPTLVADLPSPAVVVAADSGLEAADRLGLTVTLVVGDMDSVDPARLAAAERCGTRLERHPAAKDATDLTLAMEAALAWSPTRLTVVSGGGGRLDHLLAGALALAAPAYAHVEVVGHLGPATVTVVRRRSRITGRPGELVSLLAVAGPARGVTTEGLLYPLSGEQLEPGSTRGVSNELAAPAATVRVEHGVLLAVQPGELGTHLATHGGSL